MIRDAIVAPSVMLLSCHEPRFGLNDIWEAKGENTTPAANHQHGQRHYQADEPRLHEIAARDIFHVRSGHEGQRHSVRSLESSTKDDAKAVFQGLERAHG